MDPYNTADSFGAGNTAARPSAASQSRNPYAAPRAAVREVQAEGDLVLASRLGRLGAVLIDSAIIGVPAILAAISLPAYQDYVRRAGGQAQANPSGTLLLVMSLLGVAVLAFVVYQFVLLYRSGQTVGKKIVGIRIVRSDGSRASFPRLLFLRYGVPTLIGMIPYVGWIFSLADPLFIFGESRRCLHDMLADTIVVNT